jgi:Rrf2 family protein
MMRILRDGGFVTATRGQAGGYALSRQPDRINVGEVLAVLGGRLYEPSSFCDTHAGVGRLCAHMPDCSIRSVWRMLQQAVDQVLGRITLKDLLVSEQEMDAFPVPVPSPVTIAGRSSRPACAQPACPQLA